MGRFRKRDLFHVSRFDHGEKLKVERRIPMFPHKSEPSVPRLCVSPSIPGCVSATFFESGARAYIYKTNKPRRGVRPFDVWDSIITGERWILPGGELERVGEIDPVDLFVIWEIWREYYFATRKPCCYKIRIAQLNHAWDILGDRFPSPPEERFARSCADHFGIHDGEKFIRKAAKSGKV